MRALFGVDEGFLQIGYDFSGLEGRIESHYCWRWEDGEEKEYCNSLLLEKPHDVHSKLSREISGILNKPFIRDHAKACKYGITYGSQAAKVAKIIGSDLQTAEKVFDAFWEAAKPLKKLKDALARYWKKTGEKKFILGIDGRKIPTRAEHAILNSLFQSAGIICAKQAMVFHDRLLRRGGLSVDFFKEDWKNKKYAQQLIHNHDEAQIEERTENFKFKVFDTEEEAIDFRNKDSKFWSEVIPGKNSKFVLAWSPSAELIKKAVELTNKKFKMNVDLSADYMVGRDWKSTH
jgi:DNA polymerase I-like protein with 3'-5' exonuclease and polymerase domains